MKLGAEPKKILILTGLVGVAGYMFYGNPFSDTPPATPQAATARAIPRLAPMPNKPARIAPVAGPAREQGGRTYAQEFRPSLKPRKEGERPDLNSIDPTLRLDLLARLREVKLEGGERSLFEFSAAPMPKKPEPKVIPKTAAEIAKEIAASKPAAPSKPPPPPINLKFYGYTTPARQGGKRAFFLNGDEILMGAEGEIVNKRYKVVRIGINSVVMEDLDYKQQQTLPLVAEAG